MSSPSSTAAQDEIVVISHSTIFYWWPVWFVGFLMALWTFIEGDLMAIVPPGTVAESAKTVGGVDGTRDVLVLPAGKAVPTDPATRGPYQPRLGMSVSNGPGVIFAVTLCLVIVITNIQLRGLWSIIAILGILLVSLLFAAFGWWDAILSALGGIDVHISGIGYAAIATFVFAIWILTFLVYDRRMSTVFSRGQVRVRNAIGGGETTYDTLGMRVDKLTDDIFRHWLLGFGSGDLTVKTAGGNGSQFEIPNVVGINGKLERIRKLLQEREVTGARI